MDIEAMDIDAIRVHAANPDANPDARIADGGAPC